MGEYGLHQSTNNVFHGAQSIITSIATQALRQFVLHGERSKQQGPPRNTNDRDLLQSTQMTAKRHISQTKHQAPSKGQPKSRMTTISTAAMHASIAAISGHNYAHPPESSPGGLGRRIPVRSTGGLRQFVCPINTPVRVHISTTGTADMPVSAWTIKMTVTVLGQL